MVAEVYVTVPAEAEYDALVARAETEEQLALLHQLRKEILFDLSELDLALTLGTLIGRGKATPSAIIRAVIVVLARARRRQAAHQRAVCDVWRPGEASRASFPTAN